MDITEQKFYPELRSVLNEMARATFISIDFELSGIPERGSSRRPGSQAKSSLQQRYDELKVAATKFTVLQVGLTIVNEIKQGAICGTEGYTVRSYNINLRPTISDDLSMDRDITFSSKAFSFLHNHGFDMHELLARGVPFLSRQEERQAREEERARLDRAQIPDIQLKESEKELKAFVDRIRMKLTKWQSSEPRSEYLFNGATNFEYFELGDGGLSNLQKRLVHQLVRSEFPLLTTLSRAGSIEVVLNDVKRETAITASRIAAKEAVIQKQVGARWLIEGLCGSGLETAKVCDWLPWETDRPKFINMKMIEQDFETLKHQLKSNRPVIIGHNIFTDLVYLYSTFLGKLPADVGDFCAEISAIFPRVIDTKFMISHVSKGTSPCSLNDVDELYAKQNIPEIFLGEEEAIYNKNARLHEAGYDSFVTARVLIRMSAQFFGIYNKENTKLEAENLPCQSNKNAKENIQTATTGTAEGATACEQETDSAIPQLMPAWNDGFWNEYMNWLQVNGTLEGKMCLTDKSHRDDSAAKDVR